MAMQYIHSLKRTRLSGNTLPEYLLIAVLMLGIFATGFLVFGKSLKGSMGKVQTDFNAHGSQALVSQTSVKVQKALADAQPDSPTITLTYNEAGQLVPAPSAFTSGANGKQLEVNRETSGDNGFDDSEPLLYEQQNMLRDLANQAHKVAKLEGKLKELSTYSGSDIRKFKSTPVILDGQVLKADQIFRAIRSTGNDVNKKTSRMLLSWQNNRIASQVARVSSQVANHASSLSTATNQVLINNGSPGFLGGLTMSHKTHEDASFICEKGRRKDNGQECD